MNKTLLFSLSRYLLALNSAYTLIIFIYSVQAQSEALFYLIKSNRNTNIVNKLLRKLNLSLLISKLNNPSLNDSL